MEIYIRLKIEKIKDLDGKEYYLGTSEDVQGLLAQGNSIDEVIEIAADVAKIMFEIDEEWNNQANYSSLPDVIDYPLIVKV